MREAANDIRRGNSRIRQKLQYFGHKIILGTEISAQEAVYYCLGLALSESSNKCVHINTFPPEQRVRMFRPTIVLQNMPQNSTDFFQKGLLDRYEQRPDSHEGLCLADFAASYEFSKSRRRTRQGTNSDNEAEEENAILGEVYFALRDGSGFIRERNRPSIIRCSLFNDNIGRQNYFRALVMLYSPLMKKPGGIFGINFVTTY